MPIAPSVVLGHNVKIFHPDLVNIYGCSIGEGSRIGTFVEIQSGSVIGARCKISSHSFICEGVTIMDEVFIGHGVMFTNDRFPRATNDDGELKGGDDWECEKISVGFRASIGSGAVILPGRNIGKCALVAAGAVVTHDVPDFAIVSGNPAKICGDTRSNSHKVNE